MGGQRANIDRYDNVNGAQLNCGGKILDLSQPQVMGVLNITPNSFYDGGRYNNLSQALTQALRMEQEGAAIIDVGGQSTRPGAEEITAEQECQRVIPVIELLARKLRIPISIDTCKARVMREAVAAGAGLINDVCALQEDFTAQTALECKVPVAIMHMQGRPRTMQRCPYYQNVVTEVGHFLKQRVRDLIQLGVPKQSILIDPGFGFGKSVEHNLLLLKYLRNLACLEQPLMIGLSRKSTIGKLLQSDPEQRPPGSIALAVIAVQHGARLVRAHDVKQTVDALRLCHFVAQAGAADSESMYL